ncbi:MAG: aldo/keto reductase [Thermoplasmata archaeon]|nr:aldo/keto reductase [Thermoplasmata archaeon]
MTSKPKAKPKSKVARSRTPRSAAPSPSPVLTPPPDELPLAGTDRRHPSLGLGLWAQGRWGQEDERRTRATLGRAIELGIRWFDTAEVYGGGRSERILGDGLAHAGTLNPPAFVTTKVSWEHLRPGVLRAALFGSLQRLALPKVDLYLVHAPNAHVPIGETMGELAQLAKEGRVGSVGVSNFDVDELEAARSALGSVPLVVNQVRYSLLTPDDGEAVLGYCRDHSIVVEAYSPLAMGLLAGRYLDSEGPSPELRRQDPNIFGPERLPSLLERARGLRKLAKDEGVPLPSIALHWLACRGVAPIFGASRPEQVEEILHAWGVRPSDEVLERADTLAGGRRA